MAIKEINQYVSTLINKRTANYYENKGYRIPWHKDQNGKMRIKQEKITVKVIDLIHTNKTLVTKICDICKKEIPNQEYRRVLYCRQKYGYDTCNDCAKLKSNKTKLIKNLESDNLFAKKNPELVRFLKNKEDAYKYTYRSIKEITFKCPDCHYEEDKIISNVTKRGFSCSRCGDGLKYPEKFMLSVLCQLNIEFKIHHRFEWSKDIKHENDNLNGDKIYDFYIPNFNLIIETHGGQHYNKNLTWGRTLQEEKENDEIKKNLAIANGISESNYITIDCRESNKNFIKNKIMNSNLSKKFILSKIDWDKCNKFAVSSLVRIACNYWNAGINSTIKIGSAMNLHCGTIRRYLKQGAEIGWCDYNSSKSRHLVGKMIGNKYGGTNKKRVIQLNLNEEYIKAFDSLTEAAKSVEVNKTGISSVCRGIKPTSGGFKWMYKEDYDEYIKQAQ